MSNPAKESKAPKKSGASAKQGLQFRKNVTALFPVNYAQADPEVMRLAVDAVTRAGGAIMFGLTSDGGAYSVCVLSDEGKAKEYPHTSDELTEVLRTIAEYFV